MLISQHNMGDRRKYKANYNEKGRESFPSKFCYCQRSKVCKTDGRNKQEAVIEWRDNDKGEGKNCPEDKQADFRETVSLLPDEIYYVSHAKEKHGYTRPVTGKKIGPSRGKYTPEEKRAEIEADGFYKIKGIIKK